MNVFEIASRSKFRFATAAGYVSAEDLWDLPLTSKNGKPNLDDIAKTLYRKLRSLDEEVSFVADQTQASTDKATFQAMFDVVKHIIDVRLAENKKAAEAKDRAQQRQRLLELISKKEDEKTANMSLDELRAEVEKLV